jgi:hypothetical protein
MSEKFEITEYYELVALHRALHVARFAREPLVPALPGSPFLAAIAKRVVETLAEMEIKRGKPERASDWQIKIDPSGEVWQIAVRNAALEPEFWNRCTNQEKTGLAHTFLSPFVVTDETVIKFIEQVDEQTRK